MTSKIELTPAQVSFLNEAITGFTADTWTVTLAGQAGSQRSFYRVRSKNDAADSAILVVWDSRDEDWPRFIALPSELSGACAFLPEIIRADVRHGLILEEDLGDVTVKRFCDSNAGCKEKIETVYRLVADALVKWQSLDCTISGTVSSRALDLDVFLWETDYFARRCVVDFCGKEQFLDSVWERERYSLAIAAASLPRTFCHRDFQSENILIRDGRVRFVDFQGARLGPPAYDLASLLYDPYIQDIGDDFVNRLFAYYQSQKRPVQVDRLAFDLCAAQRLMQALGAYGNLSIHKGKTRYREFVPVAFERLRRVVARLPEYPGILRVVEGCLEG